MGEYKALRVILIFLDILALLAAIFFNLIAGHEKKHGHDFKLVEEIDTKLFDHSISDISDKYPTQITPAGWAFVIWGVIYLYLLIIMFYCLSTLCRGDDDGKLYYNPPYLSLDFYFFFFINMGTNIAWLFLWDREYMEATLPVLALNTFTLGICIFSAMRGIRLHGEEIMRSGRRSEIASVYGIVINGLGLYAGWTAIATLINLAVILQYEADLNYIVSSSIALGVLALDLVVYIFFDLVFFERFFRYLFTPYLVFIYALIASLIENWDEDQPNSIFSVALLACGAFALIAKIIVAVVKDRSQTLYDSLDTKTA